MGLQGHLLDAALAGSVPLAWYWSPEAAHVGAGSGDNVLAQYDGPNAGKPHTCARGRRTVRTGYACQPPACCAYQRRRAACAGGGTHCAHHTVCFSPQVLAGLLTGVFDVGRES